MDRMTKATLWIAVLVLGAYFVTKFLNCVLDPACKLRCAPTGVSMRRSGGCVYQSVDPKETTSIQ